MNDTVKRIFPSSFEPIISTPQAFLIPSTKPLILSMSIEYDIIVIDAPPKSNASFSLYVICELGFSSLNKFSQGNKIVFVHIIILSLNKIVLNALLFYYVSYPTDSLPYMNEKYSSDLNNTYLCYNRQYNL